MRIAITGARGKVGRAVTEMALAQGHSVVSIDRTPLDTDANRPNVTAVQLDTSNYADVKKAFEGSDAIVHLAAYASPDLAPYHEVHNNNVVGSYNALCAAVELGIQHVCQASSINAIGAAYSRMPHFDYFPLDEEHPTYNEDPYSLSKWICEMQGDSIARRNEDMTIASLRFHWVIENRQYAADRKKELWAEFSRNLWAYTRIDAAAEACLKSLTAEYKGHEAFFIVAPDTMIDIPSAELHQQFFPQVQLKRELTGYESFFNSEKAERLLGWTHPAGS